MSPGAQGNGNEGKDTLHPSSLVTETIVAAFLIDAALVEVALVCPTQSARVAQRFKAIWAPAPLCGCGNAAVDAEEILHHHAGRDTLHRRCNGINETKPQLTCHQAGTW